ncbi:glycosyltransferase family 4 protein [Lutimonas zeaxanthinifaciens]|uniref:glycosyltransferase family 4 protein n=1 Tax=Lutimonas zeaxanthinifaciens TaxID=3060215 RepID=UPI00265CCDC0|nr:glycosyltransferase family 4 protein [Lutimonas sp. YSD2104]WKK67367.1 glycosyltransferase family 4 protein [Lutimonas sp. YSD2104]
MRILLIHQYFLEKGDGGGSRFNEMTQVWEEQGHEVTVLAGMVHYNTGKKPKRYKGKFIYKDLNFYRNVDVIRCHVSEAYNVNFLGRLWAYFSFVFSSIWAGLFKVEGKFDVIIVTSPPLFVGITAYVLSKFKRLPFVFEIRDLWPESAIDTGVLQNKTIIKFAYWFEKFIYNKSSLINVLTPAFRDKLINEKNLPENKVIMIPNAADFSLAEKVSASFNIDQFKKDHNLENKFVITYVGAHGVANHLIQLIDAAEQLKGTNVLIQLIGSGMQKNELKQEVISREIDNVRFVDPVPKAEVFKYILASDMGASVLKKVDTFKTIYSNKTFDYMSCKKPVLLAIDGVSRELVEKANCGFYVEPEDPNKIVEGIQDAIANKSGLKNLGENGYNYAKSHFDRVKLARDYIDRVLKLITINV